MRQPLPDGRAVEPGADELDQAVRLFGQDRNAEAVGHGLFGVAQFAVQVGEFGPLGRGQPVLPGVPSVEGETPVVEDEAFGGRHVTYAHRFEVRRARELGQPSGDQAAGVEAAF
ncbi:hypothetical protein GTY54_25215 [Streptomyces sp. SID625]|nr:hypothetical protein [Streptomyces sp. SID625]